MVANCPEAGALGVEVQGAEIVKTSIENIDPLAGELVVHVRRAEARSAHITGRVLGSDGKPCIDAMISASSREAGNSGPCLDYSSEPENLMLEILHFSMDFFPFRKFSQ